MQLSMILRSPMSRPLCSSFYSCPSRIVTERVSGGQYVAVLGGGTIGMFTMQWGKDFRLQKVVVFDISEERLELATSGCRCSHQYNERKLYAGSNGTYREKGIWLCVRDGRTDPDYAYGI